MKITIATYPKHAGQTTLYEIDGVGVTLERVPYSQPADIVFQKYRKDYKARDCRPYKVGKSGYGSLLNALAAVFRQKHAA